MVKRKVILKTYFKNAEEWKHCFSTSAVYFFINDLIQIGKVYKVYVSSEKMNCNWKDVHFMFNVVLDFFVKRFWKILQNFHMFSLIISWTNTSQLGIEIKKWIAICAAKMNPYRETMTEKGSLPLNKKGLYLIFSVYMFVFCFLFFFLYMFK